MEYRERLLWSAELQGVIGCPIRHPFVDPLETELSPKEREPQ